MATSNPSPPQEISEHEKEILKERLRTLDEDAKNVISREEMIEEFRKEFPSSNPK